MKKTITHTLLLFPILAMGIQAQEKQSSPNLIFIMADQWRGDALGCLGKEAVKTPHLDQLASEGVNFTNAVSSYPVSSPARGMLMTGMYPVHSKVTGNCNSATAPYGVELPESARCWSDVLKDQGYELGYIGKWHLDSPYQPYIETSNNKGKIAWNEWCPKERRHGFSHWIAYGTYDYHLKPMYWDTDASRDEFYFVDQWGPEYETDRAIDYIANRDNKLRDAGKPFALVVSMNPPHTGYELVPDKYKEIYRDVDVETVCNSPIIAPKGTKMGDFYRKSVLDYYACMTGVDEQVGRIIRQLKEQGLFENTIVVFTSDHGDSMGMHEHIGKNIYYEEAMRIPMMISWPEKIAPRRDSTLMIAFADLYPSLLSLMGFKEQIPAEVQTFDLSASILSLEKAQEVVQPYYYLLPENLMTGYRGLRTKKYTFVVHATNGRTDEWILFDREQDPFQLNNIAPDRPALIKQFTSQLKDWLKKTNDPFMNCL
ncbi:sulfatase [Parabacteroides sp. BX2]|jgi:arylsulfatase A-like enzyme|uniref:Sulfatase n=1 Tax=Parabacteroides segnis TaxID=2763058 RepID=A0ABR7DVE7_9BACT|nr:MULTISPECIES: sulfatase [Parabacteroides]MBC5641393.1 sulfatase [Parabacteroides segnis]MCM0711141.1 sulfatase [Parabacteroides sp. TA-V-105]